ncbi:hypothetical protein HDU83_003423 [Entophlyctis luteolus]|nr:hypothetical protein HDU83_003423 [Entophlyctis luteolus]
MVSSAVATAVAIAATLLATAASLHWWLSTHNARHSTGDGFPEVGGAWPVVGHLPRMYVGTHLASRRGTRSPMWVTTGRRLLEFSDPNLLRRLFTSKDMPNITIGADPRYVQLLSTFGTVSGSPAHKRFRSFANRTFTHSALRAHFESIKLLSAQTLERLSLLSATSKDGVDPLDMLQSFTFSAICIFMAGAVPHQRASLENIKPDFTIFSKALMALSAPPWMSLLMGGTISKGIAAKNRITQIVEIITKERREAMANGETFSDALSILIDSVSDSGAAMTDSDIGNFFLVTMFAGYDTTAKQLSIMIHQLANSVSPDDMDALVNEARSSNKLNSESDLAEMRYLNAFIKESMRIRLVAPFIARVLTEDVVIDGITVPAKTALLPRRDYPQFMASGPDVFQLSNFLGDDAFDKVYANEYMPFGYGDRICLGMQLARLEVKIV